ncbi:hypothetical protein H6P81_009710 [Aristolochia fimbriata]|uniref:Ubiquitin-conjugating enzyme E2C-binding protein n=1 Tax=Aristolochia fimbriata TaxID=158543 RepID=A0AAV7ELP0_ARIFI|nr:hypothetical protein H6P81_009710 [Aristolochia fimbriata]
MESSVNRSPRKWCFTWETLSHLPTLRLYLFDGETNPSSQCGNLKCSLNLEQSLLLVAWNEEIDDERVDFVLRIPVPRILVDPGSPLEFKAREDHIEVKLVMILPVDHPLLSNFDSVLNLGNRDCCQGRERSDSARLSPLSLDSDFKRLTLDGSVHFYCKSCSERLTNEPLRNFVEMPSANWREVADNWFGSCCCSFGGISEKLVYAYANSYTCIKGTCLLDNASITICKDDLLGFVFPVDDEKELDLVGETVTDVSYEEENHQANKATEATAEHGNSNESISLSPVSHANTHMDEHHCCIDLSQGTSMGTNCSAFSNNEHLRKIVDLEIDQKIFKKGPLGNGFMINTYNLSNDIEWLKFVCSKCSALLGAYPSFRKGSLPADGGVRLFKHCIATSASGGSEGNIFRRHTLPRTFVDWLLESATDDLSFRTIVKDLGTKAPMLQIVLLTCKAWCCSGCCLDTKSGTEESLPKINLLPVVKVLYADCSLLTEAESRKIEKWASKNQANEVYMMACQIKELKRSLELAQETLPLSCSLLQGLLLSSLERSH